jgi:hypothetical protein
MPCSDGERTGEEKTLGEFGTLWYINVQYWSSVPLSHREVQYGHVDAKSSNAKTSDVPRETFRDMRCPVREREGVVHHEK